MRLVAEFGDEPKHVGYGHVKGAPSLRDVVLFNHNAAGVIRAVCQRDLPRLLALRHLSGEIF